MCEFCEKGKSLSNEQNFSMSIEGKTLYIEVSDTGREEDLIYLNIDINYCIACGRELK